MSSDLEWVFGRRLTGPAVSGAGRFVKHAIDRAGALVMLVLVAPVMVVVALALRLDGGPVLRRQARVGQHGREFQLLRFHTGATPVGAVLRRYGLDELPQLFNALAGTMSVVGPRPLRPAELATYGADAHRRLLVRPGLTGLWQIAGPRDLSWEESIRLDLRYVENWNLALDARILIKALGTALATH